MWTYSFVVTASITEHPDNLTVVYENDNITLSCNATASGPITYQWRRSSGRMISNKANGVTTPTLTISSVTQDDEDEYYCTASYGVYVDGTSHVAKSERAKVVVFGMSLHVNILCTHLHTFKSYKSSGLCIKWNWYSYSYLFMQYNCYEVLES